MTGFESKFGLLHIQTLKAKLIYAAILIDLKSLREAELILKQLQTALKSMEGFDEFKKAVD